MVADQPGSGTAARASARKRGARAPAAVTIVRAGASHEPFIAARGHVMAGTQRFWGYALVVAVALAVGAAVAEIASVVIETGVDSPGDIGGMAAIAVPAAAGLVAVVLVIDAGLRRLRRPPAKAGW
jgi:hypothetical protein